MVTVHIPTVLRDHSGGRDRVEVSGRTLRQVFDQLELECPGIKEHLLDEDEVHSGLAIVVDDEITGQGLIQPVPENATILILPALGGGVAARQLEATAQVIQAPRKCGR